MTRPATALARPTPTAAYTTIPAQAREEFLALRADLDRIAPAFGQWTTEPKAREAKAVLRRLRKRTTALLAAMVTK